MRDSTELQSVGSQTLYKLETQKSRILGRLKDGDMLLGSLYTAYILMIAFKTNMKNVYDILLIPSMLHG